LHVDKGGVKRVRAVDTPGLNVFVSKKLFAGNLHCVNKERNEGKRERQN